MSLTRKDYAMLLLVLFLWAGNVIAIKLAVTEIPPLVAAALRFGAAALVFLPFIKMPDKKTLWTVFQISMLMNLLHIGTLFISLRMLDAASTSILLQTQVVFATILGLLFFKEHIRWRTWSGIGLACVGLIIMLGAPDLARHPQAVVLMLFSTLMLSFSYVKMKHLQSVHAPTYVFLINACAFPFILAAALIFEPHGWDALPDANWTVLGTVLAFQSIVVSSTHIFWQKLMHKGDVGRITAFTLAIPFMTMILSTIFLGEQITKPIIIGGLVTMAGVGIITARRVQKGLDVQNGPE